MRDLVERVAALEAAVARLEAAGGDRTGGGPGSGGDRTGGDRTGGDRTGGGPGSGPGGDPGGDPTGAEPSPAGDPFWALTELQRRHPDGAVVFAGTATGADGPVRWQWGVESGPLLARDWAEAAPALAALGHPVRLHLLQQVLAGRRTTAELAGDGELGTSGQLHHHLRALVAAGWLRSTGRGRYGVPAPRVVPLLAIVSAATG